MISEQRKSTNKAIPPHSFLFDRIPLCDKKTMQIRNHLIFSAISNKMGTQSCQNPVHYQERYHQRL